MKGLRLVGAAVLSILIVWVGIKLVAPGLLAPAAPYADWKAQADDAFVLQPGQVRVGYQTPNPRDNRYGFRPKIVIHAASPVSVGFIPAAYKNAMLSNPDSLSRMPIFFCVNQHVLQATIECGLNTLNESYVAYIRDERTKAQVTSSTLLGGMGIKGPAEQALMRNDVHVEYFAYTCVRNCQQ